MTSPGPATTTAGEVDWAASLGLTVVIVTAAGITTGGPLAGYSIDTNTGIITVTIGGMPVRMASSDPITITIAAAG